MIGSARAEPMHLDETPTEGVLSIVAPTCETLAFSSGEFRQLLSIELAAEHLRLREPAAQGPPASRPELVLELAASACQSDARDVILSLRADQNKSEQRSVAVADIAAVARTRALALAAAELIRESTRQWKEATAPSPIDVASKPEEPPKNTEGTSEPNDSSSRDESAVLPAPTLPPRRGDLALAPRWRFFTPSRTSLFGGQLSGTLPLALGNPRLRADLGGAWAKVSDPLGTVNLSILSGGIAALFATPSSPSIFVGPRVEIGYVRGSGTAGATGISQDRGGRALVAVSMVGGLRAMLGERWSALLELEVGGALSGLDVFADERTLAELHGPFVSAGAGISYAYQRR